MKFRITRFSYWSMIILILVGSFLFQLLDAPLVVVPVMVLAQVAIALLTWARCRDAKMSSWLALLTLIPLLGLVVVIAVGTRPTVRREGDGPLSVYERARQ